MDFLPRCREVRRVGAIVALSAALSAALSVALSVALSAAPLLAQTSDSVPSAFMGFETRILPNGLKVWFKRTPGARDVSVSVAVPYGSDRDPPGKEQLAHFTEHMLFSDRAGRTEEQIKRDLEQRGGIENGQTMWDRTRYFARIERGHGLYALEWLYGIISPHEMPSDIVERQRTPVLIEVGAKPRGPAEWIIAHVIDPPWLRLRGYWNREFGIEDSGTRDYDPWRSVHAITAADLRAFYDSYYVPSRMTLTVIGDLRPDSVWGIIARTYATLPARAAPALAPPLSDPRRERRSFFWDYRSDVGYDERYKLYDRTAHDDLLLSFVSRYLSKHLEDALRFGERKAVYGISAYAQRRGRAAVLGIYGGVKRQEIAFARTTVAAELEHLRTGAFTDSAFAAERDAIARTLRAETNSAEALDDWVWREFYDPDLFRDFPDLAAEFARVQKADVVAFARRVFVPQRRGLQVTYIEPLPQLVLAAAIVLILVLGAWLARCVLLRPLPMDRLRYVARIRGPAGYQLAWRTFYAVLVLLSLRLLVHALMELADRGLAPIDSFAIQGTAYAAMGVLVTLGAVLALAAVPSKVLVFEHGVAIKSLAYRSVFIDAEQLVEVSMKRLSDLLRESGVRGLLRCRVFAPAIFAPALCLRCADGRSYLLRTRDLAELRRVLGPLLQRGL